METMRAEHKVGKAGSLRFAAAELREESEAHAGAGNIKESIRLRSKAIQLEQRAERLQSKAISLIYNLRNG